MPYVEITFLYTIKHAVAIWRFPLAFVLLMITEEALEEFLQDVKFSQH
jgi:hypothetical protein